MLRDRQCVIFAIEHYNPLGIVRSLGEAGIRPDVIVVRGKARIVSCSRYVRQVHEADSVAEGYRILLKYYGDHKKAEWPVVFCADDKTIGYLDERYDEVKGRFILFNAGEQGRINLFMDKYKILECAERNGLRTLSGVVCQRGEVPSEVPYPVITKAISPNAGAWKSDVNICHSDAELREAYERIRSEQVLIQKYIDKKNEYCIEGFSIDHGKQVRFTIASTYNYLLEGYYSPYMTIRNMTNEYVRQGLERMFADIGYEGIFEAEFLIDRDDGMYFSEINFRNSTWSWASTRLGMNLPVLWGESMLTGKIPDDVYRGIPDDVFGMVEPIDYGKRVDTGKISAAEWLADFKDAKVTYYYDKDDPEPYYEMMRNWEKLK